MMPSKQSFAIPLIMVFLITPCLSFVQPAIALAAPPALQTTPSAQPAVLQKEDQTTQEINSITQKIIDKNKEAEDFKRQSEVYKRNIAIKQSQIVSLSNQVSLLDDSIGKTTADINAKESQIAGISLEIMFTLLQIKSKEAQIADKKLKIGELLRQIQKDDGKNYFDILLTNDSFSLFFDQIKYSELLQSQIQNAMDQVKELRSRLVAINAELQAKNKTLNDLKANLLEDKARLEDEKHAKDNLLAQTQNSEARFRSLLNLVRLEKEALDQEVQKLEASIRKKISEKRDNGLNLETPTQFIWPISFQGVATQFHDPEYLFRRWVGEHSGLDLRTLLNGFPAMGLPVRAVANGTVVKIVNNGKYTGNAIYLQHGGNFLSVYLHLSKITVVEDQFVPVGKVIALSGGLAGLPGSGLSTGPHLHFEVRLNGIPVNPLDYLPTPPAILVVNKK